MIVDLNEWRTRFMLEALQTLDDKWKAIIAAAAEKGDEDTAAEYANDLAMLRTLREGFEANAVQEYGPTIANFSHEPIAPVTVPNGEHQPRPR